MSTVDTLTGNGMDDLKELQQRLNYESIKHQFRPKLIGGLNEDDVSQYIEYIEDKFHKLEQENKKYMDLNYNLKKQLEVQIEENMSLQENMDDANQRINIYIAESKNKDALVKSMNDNFSLEKEAFQNEILKMKESREELENMLSEARITIAESEDYKIRLEENNDRLKSRINSLEKENEKIEVLMEDISILTEEKAELEKMLSEVSLKIDQINEYETRQQELECKLKDLEPKLEQSREYAAKLEENNMVMTAKLAELENKTKSMEDSNAQIDKLCQELKSQLEAEKTKNEKQIMYLEMSKQKITSLEATVKESMTELEEQRKISDRSEQELQLEKAKASSNKINGFKEELESIYRKIEILEDEAAQHVMNINELQQQLSLEQVRANKAENNLTAYSKLVSDFKDKFEKEQNMLEAQYRNFLSNRGQLHSEISDLVEINII
jgi:chromosome segregation ATPase